MMFPARGCTEPAPSRSAGEKLCRPAACAVVPDTKRRMAVLDGEPVVGVRDARGAGVSALVLGHDHAVGRGRRRRLEPGFDREGEGRVQGGVVGDLDVVVRPVQKEPLLVLPRPEAGAVGICRERLGARRSNRIGVHRRGALTSARFGLFVAVTRP